MSKDANAVERFVQLFLSHNEKFLKEEIIPTASADFSEYALLNAFSWIKPAETYLESFGNNRCPGYLEDVERDTNFFNPSNVDIMSTAYHIDNEYISCSRHLKDTLKALPWTMEECILQVKKSRSAERVRRGISLTRTARYSDAITQLSDAIDIYPSSDAYVARGAAYANIGAYILAVDDFRNAIKLDPSHANANSYLGTTLEKIRNMNVPATIKSEISNLTDKSSSAVDLSARSGNTGGQISDLSEANPKLILTEATVNASIARIKDFILRSDESSDSSSNEDSSDMKKSKKRRRTEMKHSNDPKNKKKSKKHRRSSSNSKKEKKSKKSSHSKKRRSKSGTPVMGSSDEEHCDAVEQVHPILQRRPHKLWN